MDRRLPVLILLVGLLCFTQEANGEAKEKIMESMETIQNNVMESLKQFKNLSKELHTEIEKLKTFEEFLAKSKHQPKTKEEKKALQAEKQKKRAERQKANKGMREAEKQKKKAERQKANKAMREERKNITSRIRELRKERRSLKHERGKERTQEVRDKIAEISAELKKLQKQKRKLRTKKVTTPANQTNVTQETKKTISPLAETKKTLSPLAGLSMVPRMRRPVEDDAKASRVKRSILGWLTKKGDSDGDEDDDGEDGVKEGARKDAGDDDDDEKKKGKQHGIGGWGKKMKGKSTLKERHNKRNDKGKGWLTRKTEWQNRGKGKKDSDQNSKENEARHVDEGWMKIFHDKGGNSRDDWKTKLKEKKEKRRDKRKERRKEMHKKAKSGLSKVKEAFETIPEKFSGVGESITSLFQKKEEDPEDADYEGDYDDYDEETSE